MTDRFPTILIPEVREFDRINAELIQLLDAGHPLILLAGAERQRLLAFGLRGPWNARIVIDGECGPEVAAELDAPGVTVICRGNVGDGAGRSIKQGRLVVLGSASDALGIGQSGGRILVKSSAGHRAGLRQSGGDLIVLGKVGRLASERRTGGRFCATADQIGAYLGRGATGGEFVALATFRAEPLPRLADLLTDTTDPFAPLLLR